MAIDFYIIDSMQQVVVEALLYCCVVAGLIHYQFNSGCTNATYSISYGSELPGNTGRYTRTVEPAT